MFDTLINSLNIVEKSEKIFNDDMEYLAKKYLKGETDLEIPMIDDDISIPEISFNSILQRLKQKIYNLNENEMIDENILYGYVDYYFEIVTS